MMKKGSLIVAASIVATLVIFFVLSRFFVDLLWFNTLGFRAVFTTAWLTEIIVFVVATALSFTDPTDQRASSLREPLPQVRADRVGSES